MPATEGTPTGYLQLACVTWYLYDWFLTLNNEIEFVWSRKWSLTKVLYALIRFTTLALLIAETVVYVFTSGLSQKVCDAFSWGSAIGTAAVIAEVELVLQLRIYIVYNKSKKLLWINAAFYILNIVCAIIVLLEFFSQMRWVEVPPWIIGSCYDTRPKELGAVWVFPMSYELYLAVLAVWKIARNWSEYGRIEGSLLSVLVRDSTGAGDGRERRAVDRDAGDAERLCGQSDSRSGRSGRHAAHPEHASRGVAATADDARHGHLDRRGDERDEVEQPQSQSTTPATRFRPDHHWGRHNDVNHVANTRTMVACLVQVPHT